MQDMGWLGAGCRGAGRDGGGLSDTKPGGQQGQRRHQGAPDSGMRRSAAALLSTQLCLVLFNSRLRGPGLAAHCVPGCRAWPGSVPQWAVAVYPQIPGNAQASDLHRPTANLLFQFLPVFVFLLKVKCVKF